PTCGVRLIAATLDPAKLKPESTWYLATSLSLEEASPEVVYEWYRLRDWIEPFYKPVKHELGWADYHMRPERAIVRHWQLVLLAYTFSLLVGAVPTAATAATAPTAATAAAAAAAAPYPRGPPAGPLARAGAPAPPPARPPRRPGRPRPHRRHRPVAPSRGDGRGKNRSQTLPAGPGGGSSGPPRCAGFAAGSARGHSCSAIQ